MTDSSYYNDFLEILRSELIPATGCTEPISVALAGAKAREVLGATPERMVASCSGNIIKNVKGVSVPYAEGQKGIPVAAVLGALGGDASRALEVLSTVTPDDVKRTRELVAKGYCEQELAEGVDKLYIAVTAYSGASSARVVISGKHDHFSRIERRRRVSG